MLDVERLRRVEFGLHFDSDIAPGGAGGARVKHVDTDSPAAKAGFRPGDVITSIDHKATPNFMEAFSLLEGAPVGKKLDMQVSRGGKRKSLGVKLTDIPKPDAARLMWERFGMRIRGLTQPELDRLGLRRPIGLVVEQVAPQSQARREGVSPGDLITKFGGWPVTTPDSLGHLLTQVDSGDLIQMGVCRIGDEAMIQVELVLRAQ
jgi:serine protease Do